MRTRNRILVGALLLSLSACASINPFSPAKSLEQKSYALYGSFVIFEEQGAKLMSAPEVPNGAKRCIQRLDAVAKPAVDKLKIAADSLITVKRALDAGTGDKAKVEIAVKNLSTWYYDATPKVKALISAVSEKTSC